MAKESALSTGYMPRGGLPRNSVDRITYRPDITSAVDLGRKASIQTNKIRFVKVSLQCPRLFQLLKVRSRPDARAEKKQNSTGIFSN